MVNGFLKGSPPVLTFDGGREFSPRILILYDPVINVYDQNFFLKSRDHRDILSQSYTIISESRYLEKISTNFEFLKSFNYDHL